VFVDSPRVGRSHEQRLVTAGQTEGSNKDGRVCRESQSRYAALSVFTDKLPDVIQASRLNPDPEGMTKGRVTLGIIRYLNSVRGRIVTMYNKLQCHYFAR
jgi:hypothetical protein